MREMIEIASTILGAEFPRRSDIGRDLYACLERVCPDAAPGPDGEEDRQLRYLALREAILDRLQGLPHEALDAAPAGAVPEDELRAAVRETRREVERWCRIALFWSQAGVIPWYDRDNRRLYVDGRPVYQWSGHADGGPQLAVLNAFQEEEWGAIYCPLKPDVSASDTCRKLNAVVGQFIHFSVAGDQIRWGDPQRK